MPPSDRASTAAVETRRLILRDLQPSDIDAMIGLWGDRDVARYMDDFGPRTPSEVRRWLPEAIAARSQDKLYRGWVMTLRESGAVIGWLAFGGSSRGVGDVDFAYVVAAEHRGHGYGSEALRAAASYAFDVLAVDSFWGECHVDNGASARAITRAGLRFIGTVGDQHRFLMTAAERAADLGSP